MWADSGEIKRQVAEVIAHSQNIDIDCLHGLNQLIDDWQNNKKKFYRNMGYNLIRKSAEPVTFELDEKTRRERLANFISKVEDYYGNRALATFLDDNFLDFYDNILQHDYTVNYDKTIKAGSKIIKSFKYFVPEKDALRTIQDEASMLIQENKITGYLCVSIHPLDYLSSSENTYKWRSCHALDGDYRAGNLDYMIDDSTVICYIEGAENEKLPNFPESVLWNSKKWRMLLHISSDRNLIFAGRQYPFESQTALAILRQEFIPMLINERSAFISDWHNTILDSSNFNFPAVEDANTHNWSFTPGFRAFIPNGIPMVDNKVIRINKYHYHYNDLLYSTIYEKPYYLWTCNCDATTELHIGGDLKCVCCGKEHPFGSESMVCDDCYEKYVNKDIMYCDCCERRIYPGEDYEILAHDGSIICHECAMNNTELCPECGERYYSASFGFNSEGKRVCPNCIDSRRRARLENITIDWDRIFGNYIDAELVSKDDVVPIQQNNKGEET